MLDPFSNSGILGLIQGLAEWFPISSTGHLKIAEHYLDLTTTPLFNLILHLGTLVAVILYFRKEVKNILTALARLDFRTEYGKMIPLLVAGTIPGCDCRSDLCPVSRRHTPTTPRNRGNFHCRRHASLRIQDRKREH